MTKKQFQYDMQRGLGSCIIALDQTTDPEKYKDIIVWGCKHELAYDTQCEGTRSLYLFEMVQRYRDWRPFYEAVRSRVSACYSKNEWEFAQHAELLALMANAGYEPAAQLLKKIYDHLYDLLKRRKRVSRCRAFAAECDNMEYLCIAILSYQCEDKEQMKQRYLVFINDWGNLMLANRKLYSSGDLLWFRHYCEDVFGKRTVRGLLKKNKDQQGIAEYWKGLEQEEAGRQEAQTDPDRKHRMDTAESVYERIKAGASAGNGIRILFPFGRRPGPERTREFQKLYELYAKEEDLRIRIELLKLLRRCPEEATPYIDRLINDAGSENGSLSQAALAVLSEAKDERIHPYAWALLREGKGECYPHSMLLHNYRPEEEKQIVELVKSIPVSYDNGWWHSVFMDVLDVFEDREIRKPPKELLGYLYRNTLCSCCRERIVKEMGRRRMLTDAILEECRYDCNEDIRKYADRRRKPCME